MINEITLAMVANIGLRTLAKVIHTYDTQAEAIQKAAQAYERTRSFQADPELACDEINHLIDRHIDRTHEQIAALRVLEQQLRALRDTCHVSRQSENE